MLKSFKEFLITEQINYSGFTSYNVQTEELKQEIKNSYL